MLLRNRGSRSLSISPFTVFSGRCAVPRQSDTLIWLRSNCEQLCRAVRESTGGHRSKIQPGLGKSRWGSEVMRKEAWEDTGTPLKREYSMEGFRLWLFPVMTQETKRVRMINDVRHVFFPNRFSSYSFCFFYRSKLFANGPTDSNTSSGGCSSALARCEQSEPCV